MSKNPWAYNVTPAQRRLEVVENEAVLAQLVACAAAGLEPFMEEWKAKGYGDDAEPSSLVFLSPEAAKALGVEGDRLASLAARIEINYDNLPWVPEELPKGWYKLGGDVFDELVAKFGRHVCHASYWPKMRADAKRRLNTAKKALEGAC